MIGATQILAKQPSKKRILPWGWVVLYALLLTLAAFYLIPVYVALNTSFKSFL